MKGAAKFFRVLALLSAFAAAAFALSGALYWAAGFVCAAVLMVMIVDFLKFDARRGK
ncbi:MAG: hypothetical protein ACR2QC_03960 [Gammaproteobacteria bacterium]